MEGTEDEEGSSKDMKSEKLGEEVMGGMRDIREEEEEDRHATTCYLYIGYFITSCTRSASIIVVRGTNFSASPLEIGTNRIPTVYGIGAIGLADAGTCTNSPDAKTSYLPYPRARYSQGGEGYSTIGFLGCTGLGFSTYH